MICSGSADQVVTQIKIDLAGGVVCVNRIGVDEKNVKFCVINCAKSLSLNN